MFYAIIAAIRTFVADGDGVTFGVGVLRIPPGFFWITTVKGFSN